ncbi:MAG: hypothetical protein ACEY26_01155 [Candidatus Hodgkinia cicadicola]
MLTFYGSQTNDGKTHSTASINLSLTLLGLSFPVSAKLGFDFIDSVCLAQLTSANSINIASCSFQQLAKWTSWANGITFVEYLSKYFRIRFVRAPKRNWKKINK